MSGVKVIGIYTKDFSLYHDLMDAMKVKGLDFIVLSNPDRVPSKVGVVITSSLEKKIVSCKNVVSADNFRRVTDAVDKALQILRGKEHYMEIVIGIDPGEYPGVALLGDGKVVQTWCLSSVDETVGLVERLLRDYNAEVKVVRIGHGSRVYRDRIIKGLSSLKSFIEIVDETKTSPQTGFSREERNKKAAVKIGATPGRRFVGIGGGKKPTKGEIRDVQRKSRILSKGRITISEEVARKVLEGKISLKEAVEEK
ncbi:MAG: hypothetical protein DRN01_02115 [Thermoplasmata archaeon]|nr:MAG: hypothetical protein DRN01_02115 [Thermoplasmata archaeon]